MKISFKSLTVHGSASAQQCRTISKVLDERLIKAVENFEKNYNADIDVFNHSDGENISLRLIDRSIKGSSNPFVMKNRDNVFSVTVLGNEDECVSKFIKKAPAALSKNRVRLSREKPTHTPFEPRGC